MGKAAAGTVADSAQTDLEIRESAFYTHADGSTLVVTKLLATAVRFVRLGAKAEQKSKDVIAGKKTLPEEKLSIKQFRAVVIGVADVPLPTVGAVYREPREYFDDYSLDAVKIVAIDNGKVEFESVEDYDSDDERRYHTQRESIASFVITYSERVYVPARLPVIVAGGVYRDHAGAIIQVLRMEAPGSRKQRDLSKGVLAVFTVNGEGLEYREAPRILRPAIAATLDPSALTNESLAEADYAAQVSTALANLKMANEAMAEADEAKKASAAALNAARNAHKKALSNLNNLSKGQPMLPGVHAALAAGEKLAARHQRGRDDDE